VESTPVAFVACSDAIDVVYRTKYHRYADQYVLPMIGPKARAATIKLVPRSTDL
jgi:hypothetical protein